jgi:hypothetical protein
LGVLKRLVKSPRTPLQQVHNRIAEHFEQEECPTLQTNIQLENEHDSGPMLPDSQSPQYKSLRLNTFTVKRKAPDCFCEVAKNIVVKVKNICYSSTLNTFVIIGNEFKVKESVFSYPCESKLLGVYKLSSLSDELNQWPIETVIRKYQVYEINNNFFAFPLVHAQ